MAANNRARADPRRDGRPDEAYVWVWLPRDTEPAVAGVLERVRDQLVFSYGDSYLQRINAIPLFLPELPLVDEIIPPGPGLAVAGCLRDGAPTRGASRSSSRGSLRQDATLVTISSLSCSSQAATALVGWTSRRARASMSLEASRPS